MLTAKKLPPYGIPSEKIPPYFYFAASAKTSPPYCITAEETPPYLAFTASSKVVTAKIEKTVNRLNITAVWQYHPACVCLKNRYRRPPWKDDYSPITVGGLSYRLNPSATSPIYYCRLPGTIDKIPTIKIFLQFNNTIKMVTFDRTWLPFARKP